jgi:hypothetical protein
MRAMSKLASSSLVAAVLFITGCTETDEAAAIDVAQTPVLTTPDSARAALAQGEILRVRALQDIGTIIAAQRYFVAKDTLGRTSLTGEHRSFQAPRSFAFDVPATADASLWGVAVTFITDGGGHVCLARVGSPTCAFALLATTAEESGLLSRSQAGVARSIALSWSFQSLTSLYAAHAWANAQRPAYQRTRAFAEALRYLAEAHPFIVDADLSQRVLADIRQLGAALVAQHDPAATATCGVRSDFSLIYGFSDCMTAHFVSKALSAYLQVFVGEPAVASVRDRIDVLYGDYANRLSTTPNANYNYNNRAMVLSIISRMLARRAVLSSSDRATLLADVRPARDRDERGRELHESTARSRAADRVSANLARARSIASRASA